MNDAPEFELSVRVYWEDTDGAGIVYYANYLKFMERARTEWLRLRGFGQSELAQRFGLAFVVRRAELDFLRPARLDDVLRVSAVVARLGAASVAFEQTIRRGEERIVAGRLELACVNIAAVSPARIPAPLRAALAARPSSA